MSTPRSARRTGGRSSIASAAQVFRDRPPTNVELSRLRLILSTFRDGGGGHVAQGRSVPGWRDVERAIAAAFGGECKENKGVFDVIVSPANQTPYGFSVKTSTFKSNGRVLMELSNSNAKFWDRLNTLDIDPDVDPARAGSAVIELVREWHHALDDEIDVERSSYLVLTHDKNHTTYKLYWFPLGLPDPPELAWTKTGRAIAGKQNGELVWEWYGWSGGQLKFYPHVDDATWVSPAFTLEDAPTERLVEKAQRYWPDRWV